MNRVRVSLRIYSRLSNAYVKTASNAPQPSISAAAAHRNLTILHKHQNIATNSLHLTLFQCCQYTSSSINTAYNDRTRGVCWKCRKSLASDAKVICDFCQTIVPPKGDLTYFQILDTIESFDLSLSELQEKFMDMQKMFHPDKHSLSSDTEKEIAALISSLVNKAYRTLLDPLQRAVYMLEIKGFFIEEDSQIDDAEFLMQVMELNEKIAEAEGDNALMEIRNEVVSVCTELIKNISDAFQNEQLGQAKSFAIKLRYYENMSGKLKQMIPPS